MVSTHGVHLLNSKISLVTHAKNNRSKNQPSFSGNNNQNEVANAKKQHDKHVKKRIFIDVGIGAAAVVGVWALLDYFGKKVLDNKNISVDEISNGAKETSRKALKQVI